MCHKMLALVACSSLMILACNGEEQGKLATDDAKTDHEHGAGEEHEHGTLAEAEHEHGAGEEHEHGTPAKFVMPTTYRRAVREIEHRLHEISELMESKELEAVHAQADVIRTVGGVIGQLALKADSGVPRDAVREVNLAGRALAAKFDAIDRAGDSGDLPGTKKVYDEMVKLAETLQEYAPKIYACPMRCEDKKTYDNPGKCPKCDMTLQDVDSHLDHDAKHGGVFFMAPDRHHHLEGMMASKKEFRVYFYDEYTKPISADRFTAEGKAWRRKSEVWAGPADDAKPLPIRLGPGSAYLTAQVDASVKFPIGMELHIDFKDGKKPEVFNFDFTEPSKEPAKVPHDAENQHE